jgi:hypothetical protein
MTSSHPEAFNLSPASIQPESQEAAIQMTTPSKQQLLQEYESRPVTEVLELTVVPEDLYQESWEPFDSSCGVHHRLEPSDLTLRVVIAKGASRADVIAALKSCIETIELAGTPNVPPSWPFLSPWFAK